MPHFSRRAVLATGFVIGLGLWLFPAYVLNAFEPWDGNTPAYPIALAVSGLVLGFLAPSRPGAAIVGVFLGQLAVLISRVLASPASEELWPVGVVMLAGYTSVAVGIGALLGGLVRRRLHPEVPVERRVAERRH